MDKFKKKVLNVNNLPFLIFFIIMLMIHFRIKIAVGSDDIYYSSIFSSKNLDEIISKITLNNRILINICIAFFLQLNIWVWKVINVSIFTGLLIVISKLAKNMFYVNSDENNFIINCWICLSVFYIHINVLSSGAYWITGSFNYLWSITFCLCGIYHFKKELFKEKYNKKYIWIFTLLTIYACYAEQTAAILTCFGGSILAYMYIKKDKIEKYIIIHYIIIVINSVIVFLLPFNGKRFKSEVISWYPNFEMLSTMDKLYQGVNHLCNHLINNNSMIMLIITTITCIILFKKYEDKVIRLISSIPFTFFVMKVIPFDVIFKNIFKDPINLEGILNMVLYNFNNDLFEEISNCAQYFPVVSGVIVLLLIPFLFYAIYDNANERLYLIILYLAAMASAFVISFSPTIFGSGNRVFFATDLILILIMTILLNVFFKMKVINDKKSRIITYIFISISSIIALQTMLHLSSAIYY